MADTIGQFKPSLAYVECRSAEFLHRKFPAGVSLGGQVGTPERAALPAKNVTVQDVKSETPAEPVSQPPRPVDHKTHEVLLEGAHGDRVAWKPGEIGRRRGGSDVYGSEGI